MGHTRLWRLPGTAKWQQVVELLDGEADLASIAAASAEAAERDLNSAADDRGLVYAFWLLTQLPIAASHIDFSDALRQRGLDVSDEPSLLELAGALSRAIEQHVAKQGRSDIGEMARTAAVESLTVLVGQRLPGLFRPTTQDVQNALGRLSSPSQFSILAREFFSRLVRKSLGYFLSRELSNHVGHGERFETVNDHTAFNEALDIHCREASRIIKEFASGWYAKRLFLDKEITLARASAFTNIAFKKLRSELRVKRDKDA